MPDAYRVIVVTCFGPGGVSAVPLLKALTRVRHPPTDEHVRVQHP